MQRLTEPKKPRLATGSILPYAKVVTAGSDVEAFLGVVDRCITVVPKLPMTPVTPRRLARAEEPRPRRSCRRLPLS